MRSKLLDDSQLDGYPIRPTSFLGSLGFHWCIIGLMLLASAIPPDKPKPNNQLVQSHKIIFYDFRKKLPQVAPTEKIGRSAVPLGAEKSRRTVIATSPKPVSKQQSIFVPNPKIQLKEDVKTPDLLARMATSLPNLPPPPPQPKPAAKQFKPPPPKNQPKIPDKIPAVETPAPTINASNVPAVAAATAGISGISKLAPPAPKKFVPPPLNRRPKLPENVPVIEASAPALNTGSAVPLIANSAGAGMLSRLAPPAPKSFVPPAAGRKGNLPSSVPLVDAAAPSIDGSSAPSLPSRLTGVGALSRISAPRPEAAPVPVPEPGNANTDMVIANLDPSKNANREIPNQSRPGEFSTAPRVGPPSTGNIPPNAARVPDLTIREGTGNNPAATKAPETAAGRPRMIIYSEKVRGIPLTSLSVALRPETRTIPAAVDARFRGRNVYAIVIPIENMPFYTGDWIVWFAEKEQKAGETPIVFAPSPLRKLEAGDESTAGDRLRQRVQIAGAVEKEGKLTGLSILPSPTSGPVSAALQEAVAKDISAWEFNPAKRNGLPVDVDVVIEIPFNLPASPAR